MKWIRVSDIIPTEDQGQLHILATCWCGEIHMIYFDAPDLKWVMFNVSAFTIKNTAEDYLHFAPSFEGLSEWWSHQNGELHILEEWLELAKVRDGNV